MKQQLEEIELDTDARTTALPVKYQHIYELYKKQEANFWTDVDIEMDMRQDPIDRKKVSPEMRRLFDYVQAFFAVSDFVVNETVGGKILKRIKSTDITILYNYQMMMENIHSITYAKILDNAIRDPAEKQTILHEAMSIPTIKRKIDWVRKWTEVSEFEGLDPTVIRGIRELVEHNHNILSCSLRGKDLENFKSSSLKRVERHLKLLDFPTEDDKKNTKNNTKNNKRINKEKDTKNNRINKEKNVVNNVVKRPSLDRLILANAIMEGVGFHGSFAVIIWFAQQGLFPGAAKVNEQIRRDEGQHVETAIVIHNTLIKYKEDVNIVNEMIMEAVDIEADFMADAMPKPLRGMNAELMRNYLEYVADWLLSSMNYPKIYNRKLDDSFPFMKKTFVTHTYSDFFKTEEGAYKKHGENETAEDQEIDFYVSSDSSYGSSEDCQEYYLNKNWDTILDRCVISDEDKLKKEEYCKGPDADYYCSDTYGASHECYICHEKFCEDCFVVHIGWELSY